MAVTCMSKPLLEVRDLKTQFKLSEGIVHAVNGVSFTLHEGEVLGIVGESGCGKSVTSLSLLRLVDETNGTVSGQVLLHGSSDAGAKGQNEPRDLLKLSKAQMEHVRGYDISMIFQDPMTSLNPLYSIGFQVAEPLRLHRHMSEADAREEAIRLLDRVGIPDPARRYSDFPHQFSGGMRQRVMVALALACRPKILIADEPTTALDVTIQAQILDLVRELREETGTAVIIITHDLGVVAEIATHVAVMYAGLIVENGRVGEIFAQPRHPYTRALMSSIPRLRAWPERLTTIEGAPPNLVKEIVGCPFEPRCRYRIARCVEERPDLVELSDGHRCACWLAQTGGLDRE